MTFIDPRAEFMRLYTRGAPLSQVATAYNLTPEEMGLALHYARISKFINGHQAPARPIVVPPPPMPTDRVFCMQCDRMVARAFGEKCTAPFCKAKPAEAA